MRAIISLVVALAFTVASSAAQADTASAEPVKVEASAASATPANSAEAVKPAAQENSAEPLKSGLDQPLCVQK